MSPTARLRRTDQPGVAHELHTVETTLGRDTECDIAIDVAAVSRRHAVVTRTGHGYSLTDLDSRNGTYVNGERLEAAPWPLSDGDEIVLAGAVMFRFSDPLATPMAPAVGRLSGVWIDPETRAVWVDAQLLEPPLSARQQVLLEQLVAAEGDLVSRQDVVQHVWADVAAEGVSAEALDALVKRLRARLRELQVDRDYLETHRSRGFRLNHDVEPPPG